MLDRGEGIGQVGRRDTSFSARSRDGLWPKSVLLANSREIAPPDFSENSLSNINKWSMTRRQLFGLGAVGAASILFGQRNASAAESNVASSDVKQPETAEVRNAAVELAVGEPGCGLPVAPKERDERIEHIGIPKFTVDDSLKVPNPYGEPIDSIGYYKRDKNNTDEDGNNWNEINLGGVWQLNGLLRAHAIGQEFLTKNGDDYDYSKLLGLVQSGKLPPEPNWVEYFHRLNVLKEKLSFPVYALPEGAPAIVENLQWMEAKLGKGVTFNASSDHGLTHNQYDVNNPSEPIDGWSLCVKDDGELQIDLWKNYALIDNGVGEQFDYDFGFTSMAMRALLSTTMTLGIFKPDGASMYQQDFTKAYQNLFKQTSSMTLFPEQMELMFGGPFPQVKDDWYANRLLHVKLQK